MKSSRQGSALSPLHSNETIISRKISTSDAMRKVMYANDLVIFADLEELQDAL